MEKVRTNITDTPHAKESLPPEKPLEQPPTPKKPAVRQVSWDDKWKDLISRGDIDALISQIANDRVCRYAPDQYFNDVTRLVSNLAQNDIDEVIDRIGRQNIVFSSRLLLRARLILERKLLAIPSLHESFRPNTPQAANFHCISAVINLLSGANHSAITIGRTDLMSKNMLW